MEVFSNRFHGGEDKEHAGGAVEYRGADPSGMRMRLQQVISPVRHDAFVAGEATPYPSVRTYVDVMQEQALKRHKEEVLWDIAKKKEEEKNKATTEWIKLVALILPGMVVLFMYIVN